VPGGGYLLRSRVSGKCVAPLAGVVAPGTPVVQRPCAAADPTQRWAPMPNADGFALATAAGGPARQRALRRIRVMPPAGATAGA